MDKSEIEALLNLGDLTTNMGESYVDVISDYLDQNEHIKIEDLIGKEIEVIGPQPGFQTKVLTSTVDVSFIGGAAGSGKSYALMLDPLKDTHRGVFNCAFLRRNLSAAQGTGGLWSQMKKVYEKVDPKPEISETKMEVRFKSGSLIKVGHLNNLGDEETVYQGTEISCCIFDELTQFEYQQFLYLLGRNRCTGGARVRMLASCNPDSDSWVRKFIDWYVDDDGLIDKKRDGKIRYFFAVGDDVDDVIWGNTRAEVVHKAGGLITEMVEKAKDEGMDVPPETFVKSFTFIAGTVYENKKLLASNPGYLGSLASQGEVKKQQLLFGNWNASNKGEEMISSVSIMECAERPMQTNGMVAITCDVALKGSDDMVIMCWNGFHLIDIRVIPRTDGKAVIAIIQAMQRKWSVPEWNIVYDSNNLGSFIEGFFKKSKPFLNNGKPVNNDGYFNLKAQCADRMADRLSGTLSGHNEDPNSKYSYSIPKSLAFKKFGKKTLIETLLLERRAIRLLDDGSDKKRRLITKVDMKSIIGKSPDFIESILMLESLYLETKKFRGSIIW